jgi:hypothetical protein
MVSRSESVVAGVITATVSVRLTLLVLRDKLPRGREFSGLVFKCPYAACTSFNVLENI